LLVISSNRLVSFIFTRNTELLPFLFHITHGLIGGTSDIIFHADVPTFGINFSRPSAQVLLQYYNFLRLGKDGYYKVQKQSQEVAHFLSRAKNEMEPFEISRTDQIFRLLPGD
jgi:glutamate/tyrosine decarboxylase-like PLP-dependent enzyme